MRFYKAQRMATSIRLAALIAIGLTLALTLFVAHSSIKPTNSDQRLSTGNYQYSLPYGGKNRTYYVHIPANLPPDPAPLVIGIHGATVSVDMFRHQSELDSLSDTKGYIAVYPQATRTAGLLLWNAGHCCGRAQWSKQDDVGFILEVINQVQKQWAIDPARIYAVGMSNGAMMTYHLAAQASDRIAAIATIAGTAPLDEVRLTRPMSVLHFQSVDDPVMPYAGLHTPVINFPSAEAMLNPWITQNHCPTAPKISSPLLSSGNWRHQDTATRQIWGPCQNGTEVIVWKLTGPGHVWPGGTPPNFQKWTRHGATHVVDANELIWDFFSRHSLTETNDSMATPVPSDHSAVDTTTLR